MYDLAYGDAVRRGPRIWGGKAGIYETLKELDTLYRREGFNWRGTAMRHHIDAWMLSAAAVMEADSVVWFPCPAGMITQTRMLSERCGGRRVEAISIVEWPVLAEMRGLQTELPEGSA